MIDLHKLQVFQAVVQQGSFSAAAERLYITQSAVSQHIKDLETLLGQALFQRGRRGVSLTPQGEILSRYAQEIFRLIAQAEAELTNVEQLASGKITLGATPGIAIYLAPHWVQHFRARFPQLSTLLQTGITTQIVTDLLAGRLDLGFVEGELDALEHRSLGWLALADIPQRIVAGFRHPWWERESVTLGELDGQAFILRPPNSQSRIWFDGVLKAHDIVVSVSAEFDHLEAIKNAVASGLCLTVLPGYVVEQELRHGLLHAIPVSDVPMTRTIKLLWNKDMPLSPIARAFLGTLGNLYPEVQTLIGA